MTTPTIDQAFHTRFLSEVRHLYQQHGSMFRDRMFSVEITGNETVRFPRLAALAAPGPKAANGDIPIQDITHDYVEPTLVDRFGALLIDKMDQAQTNIRLSMAYAKALQSSMAREIDDIAITELANTTETTVANGGTGLTFDKIQTVAKRFDDNEVPQEGRKWAIAPSQKQDFLSLVSTTGNHPITTSVDFLNEKPLMSGQIPVTWMGFEWFVSTRLSSAASVRTTYAYHQDAVGYAWSVDEEASFDWLPLKHGWLVKRAMQLGCKIIENEGIIPIDCLES